MTTVTTKPLHPASVHAALRKGGHTKAEWHRSGRVRGWGEWSRGYRVTPNGDAVRVSYASPLRFGPTLQQETAAALRQYAATLTAAGLTVARVVRTADYLLVSRAALAATEAR